MKKFVDFLQKQKKEIELHKYYESEKQGHDVGETSAALDWTSKFAKKFRKKYSVKNMTDAIEELDEVLREIENEKLRKILEDCKEKLEDAKELYETEKENGNGKGDK